MKALTKLFAVLALGIIMCSPAVAAPVVLSDTLSYTYSGSDSTLDSTLNEVWIADLFGTDNQKYSLNTVTLWMKDVTGGATGQAQVDIYTDNVMQPGTLFGTLTPPATYPTTDFGAATFTASGIILEPSEAYWVVLHALSGEFQWGYTAVAVGVTVWAGWTEASGGWYTAENDPNLMQVTANPVPLPPGLLLLGSGLLGLAGWRRFGKK
jgi:hypothetical protein